MAAIQVMKALSTADTPSAEDQNLGSSHDANAKLPTMDKIGASYFSGARAGHPFMDGLERLLTQRIGDKSPFVSKSLKTSGFFSPRAPSISLKNYLNLCLQHFHCSTECYVLALIYINRITKTEPGIAVCSLNVHRLLFLSLLLATKFQDDRCYSNKYYARLGGLPVEEVNMLEVKFLKMLDWKAKVEPQEYHFYHGLICQASEHEGPLPTAPLDEPEAEP